MTIRSPHFNQRPMQFCDIPPHVESCIQNAIDVYFSSQVTQASKILCEMRRVDQTSAHVVFWIHDVFRIAICKVDGHFKIGLGGHYHFQVTNTKTGQPYSFDEIVELVRVEFISKLSSRSKGRKYSPNITLNVGSEIIRI